jgi:hypothetical protein
MSEPLAVGDVATARRNLRNIRWVRRLAGIGLGFPIVVTATIVLLGKVTNGGMAFFVSGDPWTHRFWSGLFYLFAAGAFLSLMTMAGQCPRCGQGFFKVAGYNPRHRLGSHGHTAARFYMNIFARKCLNCGLRIDGSDL